MEYNSLFLESKTYWEIQSELRKLSLLRYVPRCWQLIQPLLCAYYLPKCSVQKKEKITYSTIDMIPKNICYKAREKCKAIINSDIIDSELQQDENKWPKFLDCEDTNIFHESHVFLEIQEQENDTSCQTLEDLKDSPSSDQSYNSISDHESRWSHRFNHTKGQCFYPYLLPSNESHYDGIEGCELNCKSPQFTSDEREKVSNSYFIATMIALISNLLAFITILIGGAGRAIVPSFSLNHIVLVMQICCILPNVFNLTISNIFGIQAVSCRNDGKCCYASCKVCFQLKLLGFNVF